MRGHSCLQVSTDQELELCCSKHGAAKAYTSAEITAIHGLRRTQCEAHQEEPGGYCCSVLPSSISFLFFSAIRVKNNTSYRLYA